MKRRGQRAVYLTESESVLLRREHSMRQTLSLLHAMAASLALATALLAIGIIPIDRRSAEFVFLLAMCVVVILLMLACAAIYRARLQHVETLRAIAFPPTKCPKCAYDLTGLTHSGCPECGWRRSHVEDDEPS